MAKMKVKNRKNGGITTADINFETKIVVIFWNNVTNGMTLGAFERDWEILGPAEEDEEN